MGARSEKTAQQQQILYLLVYLYMYASWEAGCQQLTAEMGVND